MKAGPDPASGPETIDRSPVARSTRMTPWSQFAITSVPDASRAAPLTHCVIRGPPPIGPPLRIVRSPVVGFTRTTAPRSSSATTTAPVASTAIPAMKRNGTPAPAAPPESRTRSPLDPVDAVHAGQGRPEEIARRLTCQRHRRRKGRPGTHRSVHHDRAVAADGIHAQHGLLVGEEQRAVLPEGPARRTHQVRPGSRGRHTGDRAAAGKQVRFPVRRSTRTTARSTRTTTRTVPPDSTNAPARPKNPGPVPM